MLLYLRHSGSNFASETSLHEKERGDNFSFSTLNCDGVGNASFSLLAWKSSLILLLRRIPSIDAVKKGDDIEERRREVPCLESNFPYPIYIINPLKLSGCFCISVVFLYFFRKYDIVVTVIAFYWIVFNVSTLCSANANCMTYFRVSAWHPVRFLSNLKFLYTLTFFRFHQCIFSHKSKIFCILYWVEVWS